MLLDNLHGAARSEHRIQPKKDVNGIGNRRHVRAACHRMPDAGQFLLKVKVADVPLVL